MKLYDLLRVITHQDYKIFYQDANVPVAWQTPRQLGIDEISQYLDYAVVSIDEQWNIVIKGKKIA